MKILMVCLGNICRSPLAEGIMRAKINAHNLDWTVSSAGTGSWHVGNPPDPRSIAVAKKYGIDITKQRARQFKAKDLVTFDLIFAMDSANYQNIVKHAASVAEKQKVTLIMNSATPNRNQSVPDPYWDDNGFEQVYQMLNEACEAVITAHTKN